MVGLILKTFGQIMKCLFRCFCLNYANNNNTPNNLPSSSSNKNDYRLGSFLVSERDDDDDYDSKDMESPSIHTELKDEAKFLKSCGTLLETPIEIRKASARVKDVLPTNEDSEMSKYHSWLPSASIEKLSVGLQKESDLPVQEANKQMETSPQCLVDKEVILYTPDVHTVTGQCKNKSVRFDMDSDLSSITSSRENMKQLSSAGSCNDFKPSPYPTPLKLGDEMQTPGTLYPMYSENLAQVERARIRSQYAHNVLNPIQNFSELMALKEADYYNCEQVDSVGDISELRENATPIQSFVSSKRENAHGNEAIDVSLSQWLKPPAARKNEKVQISGTDIDRPIIGTVAAHWNEAEPSQVSPKWWDGNGIPNSTHKYNENRPVSWHATPFEERLEKALSNETLVSQRRLSIEPIGFAEHEEDDTAVSRFQASASVVSF